MSSQLPSGPMVNIGCGPHNPAGWINIDGSLRARVATWPLLRRSKKLAGDWPTGIVARDIRKGLGFSQRSLSVVYSSHTIEHLFRDEALRLLREAHQALMPGGVCRIVVPDLAAIIDWYGGFKAQPREDRWTASSDFFMRTVMLRQDSRPTNGGLLALYRRVTDFDQHKWMYDEEGLLQLFSEAGFVDASPRGYLVSRIPPELLGAVEKENRVCGGAGVCVEAAV